MNKDWLFLGIAIVSEVIATSALKASNGFTAWLPTTLVIIGYGLAFFFLSLVLRTIPVGAAYAIWSGVGVALISLVGWLIYGQKLDPPSLIGISLIVLGVAILKLFGRNAT